LAAGLPGFCHLDADIAAVNNMVAKGFKAGLEAGDTHGGGAHINAAAAGAHVERNAEDTDGANRPVKKRPVKKRPVWLPGTALRKGGLRGGLFPVFNHVATCCDGDTA
jgi:hypothetical protein